MEVGGPNSNFNPYYKMKITIKYNGKPDENIDSRLAAVLKHDLGFEWIGQGYDLKKNIRDISFQKKG